MGDTDVGPRLVALIEDQLRDGQSLRNFALRHGLDHTRFHAWRRGASPGLEQVRQVATALGMRLGDVLVECGYGTRDEFSTVEITDYVVDVGEAIERDPKLDEDERAFLRQCMEMIQRKRDDNGGRRRRVR